MDTQKLITINLMNRSPKHSWPVSASHRLFNMVLSVAIVMSLNSQAFAQKITLTPSNKKVAAGAAKTKKLKKSIDQQILAQAQSLQGTSVKIYSDEPYKRAAKAKKTKSKNMIAQSASTSTFGPSNRLEMDDTSKNANISVKLDEAKKEALPENKLNGSVAITIGHDSNLDEISREDIEGGFYEMKPSLSYEGDTFLGSFGAAIKDYSSQENSDIAKKTDINADIGAKFSVSKDVSTTSKISFLNSDFRWPDFLDDTNDGMVIRFFETKFTQSLNFSLNRLTVGVNGSYSNRDYTTTYRTGSYDNVLGRVDFHRDLNDAKLDANIALKFNDSLTLVAKPMIKHRKYKAEPARQTNGERGHAALDATTPRRELITNELAFDLKTTLGAFTITPTVKLGQDIDRALGAEDTSYSGGGLAIVIDVDKDTGFKLGASANAVTVDYDNWTNGVVPTGSTRTIDAVTTGVSAEINLSKTVALGIDYSREKYDSNIPTNTDENFNREVLGSTITVSF